MAFLVANPSIKNSGAPEQMAWHGLMQWMRHILRAKCGLLGDVSGMEIYKSKAP